MTSDLFDTFEAEWSKIASDHNLSGFCKLDRVDKINPMLVFFGCLLNDDNDDLSNISKETLDLMVNLSTVVESIHKTSLLVDNWINGEIAQQESASAYITHESNTVIFEAMCNLLKGFLKLCDMPKELYGEDLPTPLQLAYNDTWCMLDSIKSIGVSLGTKEVKEIISFVRSRVSRNGTIIGYAAGGGHNKDIVDLLSDIGRSYEYICKTLSDLQFLCNSGKLMQHKETVIEYIIDDNNVVVDCIRSCVGNKVDFILQLNDSKDMLNQLTSLFKEYNVKDKVLAEISTNQLIIKDRVVRIEVRTGYTNWCEKFNNFIDNTIEVDKKVALG